MIHYIGAELQAGLRARGCPIVVVDGPEATTTATFGRERIVIEHGDSDDFVGPWSQSTNPKRRMNRMVGVKVTIYAQSTKAGALDFEHRIRAEQILDIVLVALSNIKSVRKGRGAFLPSGGRFIVPEDLKGSERQGGAVYELTFNFERAVEERTWAGEKQPETTLTVIEMTGSPDLTFTEVDTEGDTITRSAGSWVDDGFEVGMTIIVAGSSMNNVSGVIADLSDALLTLDSTDLTDEGPVSGCAVRSGGFTNVTKVAIKGSDDFEFVPEV